MFDAMSKFGFFFVWTKYFTLYNYLELHGRNQICSFSLAKKGKKVPGKNA